VLHAASFVRPRELKTSAMAAMHNSDVIARVLEYANSPKETAARRWCLSKAWLRAHDAPALWRTLLLTALPRDDGRAHCTVSAWARAPPLLRTAVERHTRCVAIHDGGPSGSTYIPTTPYTFGIGLAFQKFARLEQAVIHVGNPNTTQGHAADRDALHALFGVAWLETDLSYHGNGFLSMEHSRDFFQHFHNARILFPDQYVPLFPPAELTSEFNDRTLTLLAQDGEEYAYNFLDREQATRLVELSGLRARSFCYPVPAGLFPHMKCLQLQESELPIQDLAAVFANVSVACPILELLTLDTDSERDTWCLRDNYSVFAHAPPRLKVLCLMLDGMEFPSSCEKASQLVALIQGHLPTGIGLHVTSTLRDLEDDGVLPVAPWAPAPGPSLGDTYDDAALARTTFTPWGSSPA
jgi:hypothetical protein